MSFPIAPVDGEIYNDYKYNSTIGVWTKNVLVDDDPWHVIGAAGEPVYQNSWVDYGTDWGGARFRKTADGTVYMQGLVRAGTISETIFTLPAGYRPIGNIQGLHIPAIDGHHTVAGSLPALIYVMTDGQVYTAPGNSNSWFSLCCSFNVGPQS